MVFVLHTVSILWATGPILQLDLLSCPKARTCNFKSYETLCAEQLRAQLLAYVSVNFGIIDEINVRHTHSKNTGTCLALYLLRFILSKNLMPQQTNIPHLKTLPCCIFDLSRNNCGKVCPVLAGKNEVNLGGHRQARGTAADEIQADGYCWRGLRIVAHDGYSFTRAYTYTCSR